MVEFYLDDDIRYGHVTKGNDYTVHSSDEEAIRLIRSGGAVHRKSESLKESNTGGVLIIYSNILLYMVTLIIVAILGAQVLTLESLASTSIDDSIDPFTSRLLEFEVHTMTRAYTNIISTHTGGWRFCTGKSRPGHSEVTTEK